MMYQNPSFHLRPPLPSSPRFHPPAGSVPVWSGYAPLATRDLADPAGGWRFARAATCALDLLLARYIRRASGSTPCLHGTPTASNHHRGWAAVATVAIPPAHGRVKRLSIQPRPLAPKFQYRSWDSARGAYSCRAVRRYATAAFKPLSCLPLRQTSAKPLHGTLNGSNSSSNRRRILPSQRPQRHVGQAGRRTGGWASPGRARLRLTFFSSRLASWRQRAARGLAPDFLCLLLDKSLAFTLRY